MAGDRLSRFAKSVFVSGHGEGWALYSERLADELGWFDEPGTRLGMLGGSAIRAARVVIDIGVHLGLPLPDGSPWTFDKACEVLRDRGRAEPYRVHAEIVRYFGWPGQAISYKLGERAWLAARDEARQRPGFDLKAWRHDRTPGGRAGTGVGHLLQLAGAGHRPGRGRRVRARASPARRCWRSSRATWNVCARCSSRPSSACRPPVTASARTPWTG